MSGAVLNARPPICADLSGWVYPALARAAQGHRVALIVRDAVALRSALEIAAAALEGFRRADAWRLHPYRGRLDVGLGSVDVFVVRGGPSRLSVWPGPVRLAPDALADLDEGSAESWRLFAEARNAVCDLNVWPPRRAEVAR